MTRPDTVDGAVALADSVEGWMPTPQLRVLVEFAAAVPPGSVIVEIGTYRGRSAVALGAGSMLGARVPVFTFDPHLPATGALGGVFGPADRVNAYENLARTGLGEVVVFCGIDSTVAASGWRQPVGLLLVDGDHHAEAVRRDVAAWVPHLTPVALVVFDDAGQDGVAEALSHLQASGTLSPAGRKGKLAWFTVPSR